MDHWFGPVGVFICFNQHMGNGSFRNWYLLILKFLLPKEKKKRNGTTNVWGKSNKPWPAWTLQALGLGKASGNIHVLFCCLHGPQHGCSSTMAGGQPSLCVEFTLGRARQQTVLGLCLPTPSLYRLPSLGSHPRYFVAFAVEWGTSSLPLMAPSTWSTGWDCYTAAYCLQGQALARARVERARHQQGLEVLDSHCSACSSSPLFLGRTMI